MFITFIRSFSATNTTSMVLRKMGSLFKDLRAIEVFFYDKFMRNLGIY